MVESQSSVFLKFIIPSWNRPRHLERCLRSIASQVTTDDVQVLVTDANLSEATTDVCRAVQKHYPCIAYEKRVDDGQNEIALKAAHLHGLGAEWAWTFGDDDLLLPGALDAILPKLRETKADFVHVAEQHRTKDTRKELNGTLWSLSNDLGWLEMTGFISCNIMRGELLAQSVTQNWPEYFKGAFGNSCAFLEVAKDRPAAFWDIAAVALQDVEQTPDTQKRWAAQGLYAKYPITIDCIELMYQQGILTEKVKPSFFRYHAIHLWDRILQHYVVDYYKAKKVWGDEEWERLQKFAWYIDDRVFAERLDIDIWLAKESIDDGMEFQRQIGLAHSGLAKILERRSAEVFPQGYL